jgi:integrase
VKYLYKHGNKFWYQRAVPLKLVELVGVRSIKVSLNTNKIQTAITRSQLQAIEHKKMFNQLFKKQKSSFLEILKTKKIKIKNYEINFLEDYEDYVSDLIFSNKSFSKTNISTIKKYFTDIHKSIPVLSVFFNDTFIREFEFKPNQFIQFKNTVKNFIFVCGDKPLNSYNSGDIKKIHLTLLNNKDFRLHFLKKVFLMAFNKFEINKKIFPPAKTISKKKKLSNSSITFEDFIKLENFCKRHPSVESSILTMMLYTGSNLYELLGLETSDIYLDKFQSFIIIRNNSIRPITNIYKNRTIPLIGRSRSSAQFILNKLNNGEILFDKKTIKKVENLIKKILISNSIKKPLGSIKSFFISRLIKIECPEEVILEIIGRSKKNNLYNREVSLDIKKSWLEQIEYFD